MGWRVWDIYVMLWSMGVTLGLIYALAEIKRLKDKHGKQVASFGDLDGMIRDALPDGVKRRHILQALHELEEGLNLCHNYVLGATGHVLQDGAWVKRESTKFQVQGKL